MLVVSNTSPVMNLAVVGELDLLRQQFGEVIVPPAVLDELRPDSEFPGTDNIRRAIKEDWLRKKQVENQKVVLALGRAGTIESSVLAEGIQPQWLP